MTGARLMLWGSRPAQQDFPMLDSIDPITGPGAPAVLPRALRSVGVAVQLAAE